jgi:hypothetical protein
MSLEDIIGGLFFMFFLILLCLFLLFSAQFAWDKACVHGLLSKYSCNVNIKGEIINK